MMTKIKAQFIQNGCHVAFTIYEMDERFRYSKKENVDKYFEATNGLLVVSQYAPGLSKNVITLRGQCNKADTITASCKFRTEAEAKETAIAYKKALKEWAEHWIGWTDTDNYNNNCDIIEF